MEDVFIGVDPGSDYTGIAVLLLQPTGGPALHLHRVRLSGSMVARCERLSVVIDDLIGLRPVVGIEKPPPAMRTRGAVEHGRQAPIGWRLGLAASLVAVPFARAGCSVEEVAVSDWRASMLLHSLKAGAPVAKPTARSLQQTRGKGPQIERLLRDEGGLFALWRGCGHRTKVRGLSDVPPTCPTCARPAPRQRDGIRDEWKRLACAWVARIWPQTYTSLVEPARSAARTNKPDHQLSGVSDACEAAGVAVHLWQRGLD